ncbi:hypothetical protein I317_04374 [Kwoniella heveanensis CBS 569]|uniref:Uncharacterized protein n=1 Tax=Kwoniella heveanensis BCC8398 TaxID=1296120 RepID=A0A1B9GST3_9TREE|nr:hypothetical protein I316_04420 [Kwoniella heveanensis BCC8398]OCF41768.1 hypothetical protein I317_04374 [Kwoniella heveanensis CBS 569]
MSSSTSSDIKGASGARSLFGKVEEYIMKCFDYQHPVAATPHGRPPAYTRPKTPISVDYVPKAERKAAADAYRRKLQEERENAKV